MRPMMARSCAAECWPGQKSGSTNRRDDLSEAELAFIEASIAASERQQKKDRRVHALIYGLLVSIILGLIGWINQAYLREQMNWFITMRPYMVANFRPYVLSRDDERKLKPGQPFHECAKDCPWMVVVDAGGFMMGSPLGEKGRDDNEGPQHRVKIARFAVSKFEVAFADWDACVSVGSCPQEGRADDAGWGRGRQPVINVSWDDAKAYVAWLSRMTGKAYRLLTEAEYEYAVRAGTTTAYPWGDEIGENNGNCNGCGSEWLRRNVPVESFAPNHLASMTCLAMCGCGWRTAITLTTTGRPRMVTAGGGVEWMFIPNWSLKTEYLFITIWGTQHGLIPRTRPSEILRVERALQPAPLLPQTSRRRPRGSMETLSAPELSLQLGCASSLRKILILRQTGPFWQDLALADGSAWTTGNCKFPVVGDERLS